MVPLVVRWRPVDMPRLRPRRLDLMIAIVALCTLIAGGASHSPLVVSAQEEVTPLPRIVVNVDAQQGWQSTGDFVEQGEGVAFEVIDGNWSDGEVTTTPNPGIGGDYICSRDWYVPTDCLEPVPNFPKGALVGQVDGEAFGIGQAATVGVPRSGE